MTCELIILAADGTMAAVLRAFFEGPFHHALSCAPFTFDPTADIIHDPLNTDGGVHRRCQDILRGYLNTHRRALVVLDQQFGGELPAEEIQSDIQRRLDINGWRNRAAVVVIDPELEVLLWQDNPNVEAALGHRRPPSLRQLLEQDGSWPAHAAKPLTPKETIEALVKKNKVGAPIAVYSQIVERASARRCVDPAFLRIRSTLREWFPAEDA